VVCVCVVRQCRERAGFYRGNSIDAARVQRLRRWTVLLNALGLGGVVAISVWLISRAGYEPWVAAVSAAASVVIVQYFKTLSGGLARARFKLIAPLLLGKAAAVMPSEDEDAAHSEPVDEVVDAVEKAGLIEMDEHQMITGIIHLDRTHVRDIMVPRTDVVAIEVKQSFGEALDIVITHSVSRVPVYQQTMDQIVGVLHVKELLRSMRDAPSGTEVALRTLLRPPFFVPETQRVDELLQELQRTKVHLAIVVDEYGGTAGIVTIEDILEEIVGEIQDEYDTGEEPLSQKLSDTDFIFNARATIPEVNETMGLDLPDESDTLGGLVLLHLEKMSRVGDLVQVNNTTFTVTAMTGRRIKKVRVTNDAASPGKEVGRTEGTESEK
jgi:magnesium and cobalt exporter, CNNM family